MTLLMALGRVCLMVRELSAAEMAPVPGSMELDGPKTSVHGVGTIVGPKKRWEFCYRLSVHHGATRRSKDGLRLCRQVAGGGCHRQIHLLQEEAPNKENESLRLRYSLLLLLWPVVAGSARTHCVF